MRRVVTLDKSHLVARPETRGLDVPCVRHDETGMKNPNGPAKGNAPAVGRSFSLSLSVACAGS
jgi:hypothetical protein